MRYRRLSATGDYTFGAGGANFLVDSPACVAQMVLTRMRLLQGEWFLDKTEGTPWFQRVLGKNTVPLYDLAVQDRILRTDGVKAILAYASQLDTPTRRLTVQVTVSTVFGPASPIVVTTPPFSPQLDFSDPRNSQYQPVLL